MKRSLICGPLLLASLCLSKAWADGPKGPAPERELRAVPFTAVVAANSTRVFLQPNDESSEAGLLRKGATVTVTGCVPDCAAKGGWALLGGAGAVSLSALYSQDKPENATAIPQAENLTYGRVGRAGILIYEEPKLTARVLSRLKIPREMAFLPNQPLAAEGWLERADGGFVQSHRLVMLTPSIYRGEAQPQLPLAFVTRELGGAPPGVGNPAPDALVRLHRYDRLHVVQVDREHVLTDRGVLPRSAVRIVEARARPPSIPADARWVHLNLAEQTLTAYEGDRAVYATLISSGKGKGEDATHPGLFQVVHKMLYSNMHGEPDDPYTVDRVPYALYFNDNEALHGSYWHDRFGAKASHGCVNLSFADARWLFDWAPPALPKDWSEVEAKAAGPSALWVLIEDKAPPDQLPGPAITRTDQTIWYSAVRPLSAPREPVRASTAPPPESPKSTAWMDLTGALIIPVQGVKASQLVDTYTDARSGGRIHDALDIVAPHNTPVVAAINGTIIKLFQSERGGTTVNQLGADGVTVFYYAHLDHYADGLKEGQNIRQGTVIGYVGDTGNAAKGNYHLHFAIWHLQDIKRYWEGTNVNPYPLLRAETPAIVAKRP